MRPHKNSDDFAIHFFSETKSIVSIDWFRRKRPVHVQPTPWLSCRGFDAYANSTGRAHTPTASGYSGWHWIYHDELAGAALAALLTSRPVDHRLWILSQCRIAQEIHYGRIQWGIAIADAQYGEDEDKNNSTASIPGNAICNWFDFRSNGIYFIK